MKKRLLLLILVCIAALAAGCNQEKGSPVLAEGSGVKITEESFKTSCAAAGVGSRQVHN